jgi:hypothetical protein
MESEEGKTVMEFLHQYTQDALQKSAGCLQAEQPIQTSNKGGGGGGSPGQKNEEQANEDHLRAVLLPSLETLLRAFPALKDPLSKMLLFPMISRIIHPTAGCDSGLPQGCPFPFFGMAPGTSGIPEFRCGGIPAFSGCEQGLPIPLSAMMLGGPILSLLPMFFGGSSLLQKLFKPVLAVVQLALEAGEQPQPQTSETKTATEPAQAALVPEPVFDKPVYTTRFDDQEMEKESNRLLQMALEESRQISAQ